MAHPLLVAENAVRLFISQWLSGLTPSLRLSTKPDGSIYTTSEVSSSRTGPEETQIVNLTCHWRRSGFHSRLRRRRDRAVRNLTFSAKSDQPISDSRTTQPPSTTTSNEPRSKSEYPVKSSPVKNNLAIKKLATVDIPSQESSRQSSLFIEAQATVSIPPLTIHHPAVVNACYAIIGKHPDQMSTAEEEEFELYKQFKIMNGQKIEDDVVYLPIGGIRTCIHCKNLT